MRALVCGSLLTLALSGCATPEFRQASALMESPIVPASDAIFGAVIYANSQLVAAPRTPADWARLQQHARSLHQAAQQLTTLAPSANPAPWREQSGLLAKAAMAALTAVESRNLDGVLESGSRIYDTCAACHAVYAKSP